MNTRCTHPATRTRFWTINDPKTEENEDVVYRDGKPVYQTVLVGMCCDCGEALPSKVMQEFQVQYDNGTIRYSGEIK